MREGTSRRKRLLEKRSIRARLAIWEGAMKPRISGLFAIAAFVLGCPLSSGQTLAQTMPVETMLYSFKGGSDGGVVSRRRESAMLYER